MPNAKAMMFGFREAGSYIDTGNVFKLDMKIDVVLVGDDSTIHRITDLQVIVDPGGTMNAMATAINNAIIAWGTSLGYTVTVSLLPSYAKL